MIVMIYILILVANTIAVFTDKKIKWLIILDIIFISTIWAGNTVGPDIKNYLTQYQYSYLRLQRDSIEIIYNHILNFFSSKGVSFSTFRLVVSVVGLLIFSKTIHRLKINPHGIYCAYLVCQFFLDGIQIRNFMAFPVFFLGLSFILNEEKNWKIKYIVCIAFSALIHESYLVYLIFLLVPSEEREQKRLIKVHGIIAFCISAVFFFFRGNLSFIVNLISSVDSERAQSYSIVSTNMGPLICLVLQLAAIFLSLYITKKIEKVKEHDNVSNDNYYQYSTTVIRRIFWINVLGIYLLPFTLIQLTFYRLIRNLALINIVSMSYLGNYYEKTNVYILSGSLYLLLWQIVEFSLLNQFDIIVRPFFDAVNFFA